MHEYINFLISGILVGFLASIPLGPIGVLCIQKTINKGHLSGFISGLGAASADTIFSIVAGFGLSFIINFIESQKVVLTIIGAVVLMYLGSKIILTNPALELRKQRAKKSKNLIGDYFSILLLTLSNPLTIFFLGGLFASFGLVGEGENFHSVAFLVLGVFIGASSWWTVLTTLVNMFRSKFKLRRLLWLNRISGLLIIILAIIAIISLFIKIA